MSCVILIGMPGSGKSTVGVLLAKALGYLFTDVDLLISHRAGKPLQKILDEDGLEAFLALEESVGSTLTAAHTVIATGDGLYRRAVCGDRTPRDEHQDARDRLSPERDARGCVSRPSAAL